MTYGSTTVEKRPSSDETSVFYLGKSNEVFISRKVFTDTGWQEEVVEFLDRDPMKGSEWTLTKGVERQTRCCDCKSQRTRVVRRRPV